MKHGPQFSHNKYEHLTLICPKSSLHVVKFVCGPSPPHPPELAPHHLKETQEFSFRFVQYHTSIDNNYDNTGSTTVKDYTPR